MKIILVQKKRLKSHYIMIHPIWVISFFFLLIVFFVTAISLVSLYLIAERKNMVTDDVVKGWIKSLDQQRREIDDIKNETDSYLDSLAVKLGNLESRTSDLDRLGALLIIKAGLRDNDLDCYVNSGNKLENYYSDNTCFSIKERIDQLFLKVKDREQQCVLLDKLLNQSRHYKEVLIAGMPVEKGWISSPYGRRIDPFTGKVSWHNGIDFAGKSGTNILAVAGGLITWVGYRNSYGLLVEINHGNGRITRYAHNQSVTVKVGDVVMKKQCIAQMGSSGRATGDHLHFEVWVNGEVVNPMQYLLQ
ncbi:Murein DD-endopeptidase MepM [invertebrate metagenome]|uniref:Murein DD-endopeptidase MepM n=1 Tax=invertebrate metagenome TaxID=1711999 RepID=A0A2H9TB03_9ZZZZ